LARNGNILFSLSNETETVNGNGLSKEKPVTVTSNFPASIDTGGSNILSIYFIVPPDILKDDTAKTGSAAGAGVDGPLADLPAVTSVEGPAGFAMVCALIVPSLPRIIVTTGTRAIHPERKFSRRK
jgi:hypothetical protein